MEVDYTGIDSVKAVIKQTGLNRFIIYKYGDSRNKMPVLNFSDNTGSFEKAISYFDVWAKHATNNNPYEMLLFKGDADKLDDENNSKKKDCIKFSFRLSGANAMNGTYGYESSSNIGLIMENATLKAQQQVNDLKHQMQLDEIKREIKELKEEQEDDDSDELEALGKNNWIGALVEHLLPKKAVPAINGPEEETQAQTKTKQAQLTTAQVENIKKAISILSKYDNEIDTDLLKLAAIAQQKPDTFKMLLGTLRNM